MEAGGSLSHYRVTRRKLFFGGISLALESRRSDVWALSSAQPTCDIGLPTHLCPHIAPDAVSNAADLQEYFILDGASMFSDAGFTPVAIGASIHTVKAQNGRGETWTQTREAHRPTYRVTPPSVENTRCDSAHFDGRSQYLETSYEGRRRTTIFVYRLDANDRRSQFLLTCPVSATAGETIGFVAGVSPARDGFRATGHGRDAAAGWTSASLGPLMCDAVRKDAATGDVWRAGRLCADSAHAIEVDTLPAESFGRIGARISNKNDLDGCLNGNVCAMVSYSTVVPDAEMPGLMHWLMNRFGLAPHPRGRYFGMFFGGSGTVNDEDGSVVCFHTVVSDDLKSWTYRPSAGTTWSAGGVSGRATEKHAPDCRDFGIAYDASSRRVLIPKTGSSKKKHFDIHYIANGFDIRPLRSVDMSAVDFPASGSSVWAPEFVRTPAGSMWLDSSGLPVIVVAVGAGIALHMKPAAVRAADTTYGRGGDWTSPHLLRGFTDVSTFIDCSCTVTADGVFHLFGSGQSTMSVIYHYTARSDVPGNFPSPAVLWTKQANPIANDPQDMEGPQIILMPDGVTWRMIVDNQGAGYFWCDATAIGGPYGTPTQCACDFVPEHGNFIPYATAALG